MFFLIIIIIIIKLNLFFFLKIKKITKKKKKMFYKKESLLIISNYITKILTLKGLRINIINNNLYFCVNINSILLVLTFFKKHGNLNFNCLIDIIGNDLIYQKKRFNLIYCLLNYFFNYRFFIKTSLEKFKKVNSSSKLFLSAN